MREKRVSIVVLICSILVATCVSVSCHSLVTLNYLEKYVAVIGSTIPILFSSQIGLVSSATVWIPEEEAVDTDGSVKDEFAEVAHVFATQNNRVVRPKAENEITQQSVPWTSLKNEWAIYKRIQDSKRKTPEEKRKKNQKPAQQPQEENSSEEEEEEDDDEDEEEEEEPELQSTVPSNVLSVIGAESKSGTPAAGKGKKEAYPLAFYGQQNHDDDEKDFWKDEATIFKKKKNQKQQKNKEEAEDDDDNSASNENDAGSVEDGDGEDKEQLEDYADYAQDDDDEEDDSSEKKKVNKKPVRFEDIPLAIREMILNDLANQNNGSGYHPNLTPQVTDNKHPNNLPYLGQDKGSGGSSASVENDDESKEANSSEEEDDNNAAEVVQPLPDFGGLEPTPPAIRPTVKGDDGSADDEEGGKSRGGKGKGDKNKKGKKGKGKGKGKGWGNLHIHHPAGWGWNGGHDHHHHDKGWGWNPEKHDGLLEQLVRGSTWERVLQYYHWKRDQAAKEENHHDPHAPHNVHTKSHPPHHKEHPGYELSHGPPEGWGWEPDSKIKNIAKKALKGSFWERAYHTYAKYKENQSKNPQKPAVIDLDSQHGLHMDLRRRL